MAMRGNKGDLCHIMKSTMGSKIILKSSFKMCKVDFRNNK